MGWAIDMRWAITMRWAIAVTRPILTMPIETSKVVVLMIMSALAGIVIAVVTTLVVVTVKSFFLDAIVVIHFLTIYHFIWRFFPYSYCNVVSGSIEGNQAQTFYFLGPIQSQINLLTKRIVTRFDTLPIDATGGGRSLYPGRMFILIV